MAMTRCGHCRYCSAEMSHPLLFSAEHTEVRVCFNQNPWVGNPWAMEMATKWPTKRWHAQGFGDRTRKPGPK